MLLTFMTTTMPAGATVYFLLDESLKRTRKIVVFRNAFYSLNFKGTYIQNPSNTVATSV